MVVSNVDHPLMWRLTRWNVGVFEANQFDAKNDAPKGVQPPPTLTPLIESGNPIPLLFTLVRGSYTDLVQTFAIVDDASNLNTNWPLQPSFPLFLRNVLFALGNVNDAIRKPSVRAGEPVLLRPEAGVQRLRVTNPLGDAMQLQRGARADFLYGGTEALGIYDVASDSWRSAFAVNLLDAGESNIEPLNVVQLGDEKIQSGQARKEPHDLWKWVVLAAFLLVLLEWYVYNRRVYV
jgi:hypothetical protein